MIVRRPIVCLLAWGLFLVSCPQARAYGGDVAVIQSQDLPLYEQALSGFGPRTLSRFGPTTSGAILAKPTAS
jgi:nucleotidyltransferase/DNA polymerase involved in DNA repair